VRFSDKKLVPDALLGEFRDLTNRLGDVPIWRVKLLKQFTSARLERFVELIQPVTVPKLFLTESKKICVEDAYFKCRIDFAT